MFDKELITILRTCSSSKGHRCSECPIFGKGDRNCVNHTMIKAANVIEHLESENAALREQLSEKFELITQQGRELNRRDEVIKAQDAKLSRVTAERDAAIDDLQGKCSVCVHYTANHHEGVCAHCSRDYTTDVLPSGDFWQWRGPQKEELENDD